MPKISQMYRATVRGSTGRKLGKVADVLFDRAEPRVVGFLVRRTPLLWIIKLKPQFAPWPDDSEVAGGAPLMLSVPSLLSPSAADRALGYDWDETVVWRDMVVTDVDGTLLGKVKDVGFGRKTGAVRSLTMSEGTGIDLAVGTAEVPGRAVSGFEAGAVVIDTAEADDSGTSGGAARAAATAYVQAKVAGEGVVDKANAALDDSPIMKAAAENVKPEEVGRTVGGWYRAARKAADRAMDDLEKKS
jgi:sporulation protein YlmC with PRC-barrel domain